MTITETFFGIVHEIANKHFMVIWDNLDENGFLPDDPSERCDIYFTIEHGMCDALRELLRVRQLPDKEA